MLSSYSNSGAFFLIFSLFHQLCSAVPYEQAKWSDKGLKVTTNACDPSQTQKFNDALHDIKYLAGAGMAALEHPDQPPYNYFFRPQDIDKVKSTIQSLIKVAEDPNSIGDSYVQLLCNDDTKCSPKGLNLWGRVTQTGFSSKLVFDVTLCQRSFDQLARNPLPCTTSPGLPSLGWVMVKYLIQMEGIIGGPIMSIVAGPAQCHDLVVTDGYEREPWRNAENWAYFMNWAYDLGYSTGQVCSDHWDSNPQAALPPWVTEVDGPW
ncbi:MAG: hypothetical protein LQ345_001578 [Seirophora villosa]|nr:MAG: hypothetical protein LQ345_001578 [Seirophora villosa]